MTVLVDNIAEEMFVLQKPIIFVVGLFEICKFMNLLMVRKSPSQDNLIKRYLLVSKLLLQKKIMSHGEKIARQVSDRLRKDLSLSPLWKRCDRSSLTRR